MASEVTLSLTFGQDTGVMVLLDPVGPNNTWTCTPAGFLSADKGKWSQGLASLPVYANTQMEDRHVLVFQTLNMFHPKEGQKGSALHSGDGGIVADQQLVDWIITRVA